MVKYLVIISLFAIALFGCQKPEERSCFKSIGELSSYDTIFSSFDTLRLYDDIEYSLVPDTIFRIEVEGGKNLINHVSLELENNSLIVMNKNKCNFLRKLNEKIKVTIHVQDVNYIHYEGSEELISSDTLHSSELRFFIRDGVGDVDLTVNNGYTSGVVSHGWGSFILRGKTLYAYLNCNTNSYCDASALAVEYDLRVNSNTQGDMYVNADGTNYFQALINQKGNIFYEGTPGLTSFDINHEGDIIHLNN